MLVEGMSTSRSPNRSLHPERISLARMRCGLNKVELSELLGVSARTITTFESDGAGLEWAPRLASVTKFPTPYFTRGSAPEIPLHRVNFRAGRGTTSRQKHAAIAAGVSGIEADLLISGRYTLPSLDVPDGTGEPPELMARLLREAWGLGTKPLPNLVQLSESKGIRVYGLPPLAESVDAYSTWSDAVPYIFLARRKTPERTRFDVAHELGHLVLHGGSAYCESREAEKEANAFAGEFLMPRSSMFEYLPRNPGVAQLLEVKTAFKVSAIALAYRAHKVGMMSDWTYRHTMTHLGSRGFREGEPNGMRHHEGSRVFPQVFSSTKKNRLGAAGIARELALPESDVHALTFNSEMHLVKAPEPTTHNTVARPASQQRRRHLHAV